MKKYLRFIKRILKKIINLTIALSYYLYEMITSLFDDSLRICFTNFWQSASYFNKTPRYGVQRLFDDTLLRMLNIRHIKYRIVRYYKPYIQLFSVFGKKSKLKNSRALCKIFYTGENVNDNNWIQYKENCICNVDLSIGFDYLDVVNYIRCPIWLFYFFQPYNSKDEIKIILDDFKNTYTKTKFCALLARHDNSGIRTKIYNEVSKIAPIDCPSKLFHNDHTLNRIYKDNKRKYLQQYKFNICPENSISNGYCTEKLFESLYSGCIPIYNGGSKNPEPDIINPNIILWYDKIDNENNIYMLNEIRKLQSNDNLYRSFIEQPFFCNTAVDKIYNMFQLLNDKMQDIINRFSKK